MCVQIFTLKSFSVSILPSASRPGRAQAASDHSAIDKSYLMSSLCQRKGLFCAKEARSLYRKKESKKGEIYIFLPNYTDRRRRAEKEEKHCKPIKVEPRQGHDDVRKRYKEKGKFYILESQKSNLFFGHAE